MLTRILADDSVVEIVRSYFIIPEEIAQDPILAKIFVEQASSPEQQNLHPASKYENIECHI